MACGAFPHQVSHWIHTMYRCTPSSIRRALLALTLGAAIAPLAQAQAIVQRPYPQSALRGSVEFGTPVLFMRVPDGRTIVCSPGLCLVSVNTDIVWQIEFSAGLVIAF